MVGGGTILIKSNHTPFKWVTHKLEDNNTEKVFWLLWMFWAPRQASQTRYPAKGLRSPGNASGIWLQDFHRTRGSSDSRLREHKQYLVCNKNQRKGAVTPQEIEVDLPASVEGPPIKVRVDSGSLQGQGYWQQQPWKMPLGLNPLRGYH